MKHTRRTLLAGMAALALLAAACGTNGDEAVTPPDDEADGGPTVQVDLDEFSVTPSAETAPPGPVRFEVTNVGGIPHEFLVIRTDVDPDALPVEGGRVNEDDPGLEVVTRIQQFAPNNTQETGAALEAGRYVLICNIPGHYDAGMTVGFTVQ